jgi:hypothetical protein
METEVITMANMPKKTYRAGACSASVFLNERKTPDGTVELPSVSFQCRYRDDQTGEWKDASSMSPNEVSRSLVVLKKALDFCWVELEAARRKERQKE